MSLVEIVLRSDALHKGGGDVLQARRYGALAKQHGHEVEVSVGAPKLSAGICHLFNVDRSCELVRNARLCGTRPYIISTIHHKKEHLQQFYRKRGGALGVLERHAPSWLTEALKDAFRARSPFLRPAFQSDIYRALERASAVTVLAEGEAHWLRQDFGFVGNVHVLPNGVERTDTAVRSADSEFDVIVVGRIELRKNQLEVARILGAAGLRVLFLGPPNDENRKYVREFQHTVDCYSNLVWNQGVPSEEVADYYRVSRVSVSASFFEVLSLADLEAASAGCSIVASKNGNTEEFLGNSAAYVHPMELMSSLAAAVDDAVQLPNDARPRLPSWSEVGVQLSALYDQVGSS